MGLCSCIHPGRAISSLGIEKLFSVCLQFGDAYDSAEQIKLVPVQWPSLPTRKAFGSPLCLTTQPLLLFLVHTPLVGPKIVVPEVSLHINIQVSEYVNLPLLDGVGCPESGQSHTLGLSFSRSPFWGSEG